MHAMSSGWPWIKIAIWRGCWFNAGRSVPWRPGEGYGCCFMHQRVTFPSNCKQFYSSRHSGLIRSGVACRKLIILQACRFERPPSRESVSDQMRKTARRYLIIVNSSVEISFCPSFTFFLMMKRLARYLMTQADQSMGSEMTSRRPHAVTGYFSRPRGLRSASFGCMIGIALFVCLSVFILYQVESPSREEVRIDIVVTKMNSDALDTTATQPDQIQRFQTATMRAYVRIARISQGQQVADSMLRHIADDERLLVYAAIESSTEVTRWFGWAGATWIPLEHSTKWSSFVQNPKLSYSLLLSTELLAITFYINYILQARSIDFKFGSLLDPAGTTIPQPADRFYAGILAAWAVTILLTVSAGMATWCVVIAANSMSHKNKN